MRCHCPDASGTHLQDLGCLTGRELINHCVNMSYLPKG